MTEMVLPQFGMGMSDGTITAWHKAVGDAVVQGEPLCEIEAAKTTVEVGAPCDGFLQRIVVAAGINVPVNSVIAIISDSATAPALEPVAIVKPNPAPTLASAPPQPTVMLPGSSLPHDRPGQGPQVEPRARRAARLHNIDLALIQGSGPGGRIVEEDITRSRHSPPAVSSDPPATSHAPGGSLLQLRMRCDAEPLGLMLEELSGIYGRPLPVAAALARATALAMTKADIAGNSIGIKSDDGSIKTLESPCSVSLNALTERLAGEGEVAAQSAALVIEVHQDGWLDELVCIDPAKQGCISFAIVSRHSDSAGEWHVTFTGNNQQWSTPQAKILLKSLKDMLGNPIAILV